MKVTVGAKELKKGKTGVAQSRWHKTPCPTRHRAYRVQERHGEGPSWSPFVSRILLEARHSAKYEFWLVIDSMIVFIFTSCRQHETGIWMAKFSKPTCRSVNVKKAWGWGETGAGQPQAFSSAPHFQAVRL
jgi:hypothetical protein